MNGHLINHIMYADDLVMVSPSSECKEFGMSHDVKCNAKKSAVVIFRYVTLEGCSIHEFKLKGVVILCMHVVATYKYLGDYISDDL